MQEAFASENDRLAGEASRLLEDPGYNSYNHQHFSYVARGKYSGQVQRYIDLFDRKNLLFLEAEELWADPAPVVAEVFRFLELDQWEPTETSHMNATKPGSAPTDLADWLGDQFAASNFELEGIVGRRFSWR
jgi:hypothetical protein